MKIRIDGKAYEMNFFENALAASIIGMMPFSLMVERSADHEYYASLPVTPDVSDVNQTSFVKAGGIYYFKDWNAFSINFKDMDISPYRVYEVGELADDGVEYLRTAGNEVSIETEGSD